MFDLTKKEFTGVSIDEDLVRFATISIQKDHVKLVRVQTAKLVEAIFKPDAEDNDSEVDNITEDDASIFGIDIDTDPSASLEDTPIEDWDMADEGISTDFKQDSNGQLMANLLRNGKSKSVNLGLTIPFGQTYFQVITDIDPKKSGKRKTRMELLDRLEAFYNHPVNDDQLRYFFQDDGTLFLNAIEAEVPALKLVDEALPVFEGKINVRDISSEENLLVGLVRTNYEIQDHHFTCIIHVEDQSSRVIFMKGAKFHSVLPEINEGSKTARVMRTIFSKILFEVDRGKIPTLDKIVLTGDTVDGKLVTFLSDQFLDVEVSPFQYSDAFFQKDPDLKDNIAPYIKSIAAAWKASEFSKEHFFPINFTPKYVATRQQVFKLEWHGFILLAMIFLAPVVLNNFYQEKRSDITENEAQILRLDQQIREARAIADVVDLLSAEFNTYNTTVTLLDTLSFNTLKWSRTLRLMNAAVENVNSIWFTSFQADDTRLIIQGHSLYRDRIPRLSNSFADAVIQQVVEREDRGIITYEFTLLVNKVVNDYRIFKPEKVVAPDDLLRLQENRPAEGIIQY